MRSFGFLASVFGLRWIVPSGSFVVSIGESVSPFSAFPFHVVSRVLLVLTLPALIHLFSRGVFGQVGDLMCIDVLLFASRVVAVGRNFLCVRFGVLCVMVHVVWSSAVLFFT